MGVDSYVAKNVFVIKMVLNMVLLVSCYSLFVIYYLKSKSTKMELEYMGYIKIKIYKKGTGVHEIHKRNWSTWDK